VIKLSTAADGCLEGVVSRTETGASVGTRVRFPALTPRLRVFVVGASARRCMSELDSRAHARPFRNPLLVKLAHEDRFEPGEAGLPLELDSL
jgi:hypothetical protein